MKTFFLLASFLALFLLPACIKKTPEATIQPPKILRWAVERGAKTLDWNLCQYNSCHQQAALMMEGLFQLQITANGTQAIPRLAKTIRKQKGNQVVISLREDVRWSDGEKLSAQHFLIAWQHLLQNKRHSRYASLLFPIVNAEAFSRGKLPFNQVGLRAPNDQTLILQLNGPTADLPVRLSHPATWPLKKAAKPFARPGATLGPFLLKVWAPSGETIFTKNLSYYRGPPPIDEIRIRVIPNSRMRIQLFLNKEIDIAQAIPASQSPLLKGNPALKRMPLLNLVALVFDTKQKPFDSEKIRIAMQQAIDRRELVRLFDQPLMPVTALNPTTPFSGSPSWALAFHPKNAKSTIGSLIAKKSFPTPPVIFWKNVKAALPVAKNLQAQWIKNLGLSTKLQPPPATNLPPKAPRLRLVELPIDPYRAFPRLNRYHFLAFYRYANWKDTRFDQSLRKAAKATNLKEQNKWLREAERRLVAQSAVVVPLYYRAQEILINPEIKGLNWSPVGVFDLQKASLN